MEIQGFVIGEKKSGKLARVALDKEVSEDEFRKIAGAPSLIKVPGLYNFRIVDVDFVDLKGKRHKKIEWFGQSDSCEADAIFELLP